mgnify:CR=1 FL=1
MINKYLYPDLLEGMIFSVFIIAVAAAETALAIDGLSFINQKQRIAIDNQAVNLSELNVILDNVTL